jgi:hypothetical protein
MEEVMAKKEKIVPVPASKASFGMVALLGTPGSAVLPIK